MSYDNYYTGEEKPLTYLDEFPMKSHRLANKEELHILALALEADRLKPNRIVPNPYMSDDEKIEYYQENISTPTLVIELESGFKFVKQTSLYSVFDSNNNKKLFRICNMTYVMSFDNKKIYYLIPSEDSQFMPYDFNDVIKDSESFILFWEEN